MIRPLELQPGEWKLVGHKLRAFRLWSSGSYCEMRLNGQGESTTIGAGSLIEFEQPTTVELQASDDGIPYRVFYDAWTCGAPAIGWRDTLEHQPLSGVLSGATDAFQTSGASVTSFEARGFDSLVIAAVATGGDAILEMQTHFRIGATEVFLGTHRFRVPQVAPFFTSYLPSFFGATDLQIGIRRAVAGGAQTNVAFAGLLRKTEKPTESSRLDYAFATGNIGIGASVNVGWFPAGREQLYLALRNTDAADAASIDVRGHSYTDNANTDPLAAVLATIALGAATSVRQTVNVATAAGGRAIDTVEVEVDNVGAAALNQVVGRVTLN